MQLYILYCPTKLSIFALGFDSVGSVRNVRSVGGVPRASKIVPSVEELKYILFTVHPGFKTDC